MAQQLRSWAFIEKKLKLILTQNLCVKVHSSLIPKSSKLKTTQMSSDRLMAEEMVAHPDQEILLSKKREPTTDAGNRLDESPGNYA